MSDRSDGAITSMLGKACIMAGDGASATSQTQDIMLKTWRARMLFPDHFLAVRATVEAEREDEFNRWYDEEHVADAVSMFPGCLGGARYKVVDGDGSHQYVALYAFGSAAELKAALAGPAIKELARRYDEAIGSFSTRSRTTYTKVFQMDSQVASQRPQAS